MSNTAAGDGIAIDFSKLTTIRAPVQLQIPLVPMLQMLQVIRRLQSQVRQMPYFGRW